MSYPRRCKPVFGRSANGSPYHRITLDPKHPLTAIGELLEPHYERLRQETVRDAVHRLLGEIASTRY